MTLLSSDMNLQQYNVEPPMLIDEVSTTEYYIGVSINNSATDQAYWKIKKIYKNGNVWHFTYPDGNQDYKFVWDLRLTYTYLG